LSLQILGSGIPTLLKVTRFVVHTVIDFSGVCTDDDS
ncbi:hypothetical protein A2U01_0067177, partial [Trifolium medium]|nr:hypothetical protein [Trifolium medium]